MPGMTSLGIPYPLQGETVTAQSWEDLAVAVDGLMTSLDTIRDLAEDFDTAQISGGSVAVATGVTATIANYSTESWDTAGWVDLGVSPNQITVPPGLYFVNGYAFISGGTTYTMARLQIMVAGTPWAVRTTDGTGTASLLLASVHGFVMCTAASTALTLSGRWVGTGGPATFSTARFQAVKIRALANV